MKSSINFNSCSRARWFSSLKKDISCVVGSLLTTFSKSSTAVDKALEEFWDLTFFLVPFFIGTNCFLSESSPWSIPSLDCSSVGVRLSEALFTASPSDSCSDEEDSTAMSGLHESLVWTSGNSWLNQDPSCFSSWTLFTPVEVLTVNAIFLHSDMHFLNLFLSWYTLNGKLPSSYLWPNSFSTLPYISAFFEFFVFVKINFFL